MRFRTVSREEPGWTRKRAGRGFRYLDEHGKVLEADDRARCVALAIPPAWEEVWICRWPSGHLQATGRDAAGRVQYLYHPRWRALMEERKHERVLEVAAELPRARRRVRAHLRTEGLSRVRALATTFRLLDRGLFRVGNVEYVDEDGGYGLATLRRDHVVLHRDPPSMEFSFDGKGAVSQRVVIEDRLAYEAVAAMRRRRGGESLLAYREAGAWHEIRSADVNDYLRHVVSDDMTAKDFRTWHATVDASVALARVVDEACTPRARSRAVADAMRAVAAELGNTPAVARASYVNPRVVELFDDGVTIAPALQRMGARADRPDGRAAVERAVLTLLSDDR
ncbi:DNA topoisomerase IB [Mumia sp. ZJ1417]|uniref:DNA topoisomerase IB n=1 Tax=unclassified Mumia TaxID=2621872 RepID=UPI00141EB1ED|nr:MULTISPECIES: DNA topoisomerase IB [unclassified Mumia]QMW66984.1 DNA topoisomerase IB [Mumia sp. ZJ1417]